ncbi:MAG: hypothetical protein EXS35_10130 [Pedosphaera sp.]|nr:hypothetical protein [Pedosphaera sp.]
MSNLATTEPRTWSRSRWWLLVGLVFAAHLGFIFAFGDRKPIAPRPLPPTTVLTLSLEGDELLALNDPTLFALPNRHGFAGAAWLELPQIPFHPYRWTEPPRLLPLPVAELGATFVRFLQTNAPGRFAFETKPAPVPTIATAPEITASSPPRSTFRLADGLTNRRWLNPPELAAQPAADLLTNTVAQVSLRGDGSVLSAAILPPGSGSAKADEFALDKAKSARFEPVRSGGEKLTVGTIVFEWATVPLLETNKPPANP